VVLPCLCGRAAAVVKRGVTEYRKRGGGRRGASPQNRVSGFSRALAHRLCFASSVHHWTLDAIGKRKSKFCASAKGWHLRVPRVRHAV